MAADPQNRVNEPATLEYRGAPRPDPVIPYARATGRRPMWGYVDGAFEMRGDVFLLLLSAGFGSILAIGILFAMAV